MGNTVDKVNHQAAPADDVVEAIHGVMHALRSRQHAALTKEGIGLTPLEGRVLGFFARHPGATQRDLADHSGRDKGQVARLVRGMHERGLLDLTADPADGRVTRVHLSAQAQGMQQTVLRHRKRLAQVALQDIDADQRRLLLEQLQRIRQNIEAQG